MGKKSVSKNSGGALTSCINDFLGFVNENNCSALNDRIISFKDNHSEYVFGRTVESVAKNDYFARIVRFHDRRLGPVYCCFDGCADLGTAAADLLMRLAHSKLTGKLAAGSRGVNLSYVSRAVKFILHYNYRNSSGGVGWIYRKRSLDGGPGRCERAPYEYIDSFLYRSNQASSDSGVRLGNEYSTSLSYALELFDNAGILKGFRADIKRFIGLWLDYYDGALKNSPRGGKIKKFDKHGFCVIWHSFENFIFDPSDDIFNFSLRERKYYDKNYLSKYYERISAMKKRLACLKDILGEFELSDCDKLDVLRQLHRLL